MLRVRCISPSVLAVLFWGCFFVLFAAERAYPQDDATGVEVQGSSDDDQRFYDPLFDDEFDQDPASFPDPWEGANRGLMGFNRRLDRWLLDPLTRGYRWVAPAAVRSAVRRFFANVGSVPIFANDVLQLRLRCAAVTFGRVLTNSSIGIGGLFDPARRWGLERHEADFGQTLSRVGIGSGPYLVMPLLGPTTLRDGTATLVDAAFNPAFWVLGPAQQVTYGGGAGLSTRDAHFEALMALAESSVDYYAALRNGYYQSRMAQLENKPSCATGCGSQ